MEALGYLLVDPSRRRTTALPRHSCLIKPASRTTSVKRRFLSLLSASRTSWVVSWLSLTVSRSPIITLYGLLRRSMESIPTSVSHVAVSQRRVSPRQHPRENLSGLRIRNQYPTCNLPHRETISWMLSNLTSRGSRSAFRGKRRSIAFKHTARSTDSTSRVRRSTSMNLKGAPLSDQLQRSAPLPEIIADLLCDALTDVPLVKRLAKCEKFLDHTLRASVARRLQRYESLNTLFLRKYGYESRIGHATLNELKMEQRTIMFVFVR